MPRGLRSPPNTHSSRLHYNEPSTYFIASFLHKLQYRSHQPYAPIAREAQEDNAR